MEPLELVQFLELLLLLELVQFLELLQLLEQSPW